MFTVNNLIDSFDAWLLASVRSGIKKQVTREWYDFQLRKLRKAAGNMPAAELRVWHLNCVTLSHHLARAVKALYGWALENDLVPKNPFTKLEVPKAGQRERVLSRAELVRLYVAASRPFRRYLFVMAHTIARPGEIRQLRWDQIDLTARVIRLSDFKAKNRRRDGMKVRMIPLDRRAVCLLSRIRRSGEYVFGGAKPWTYHAVRSMMRRARAAAGLNGEGERIVCYSLRHTGATNAIRAGVSISVLAEMMGHTKVTTTQRYQHLDTADLVDGIDQVASYRGRKNGC